MRKTKLFSLLAVLTCTATMWATQPGTVDGKMPALFTVNEYGDQVQFSQGNLQYIGSAATPYWKFADNQYDIIGTSQATDAVNVDRDLFGWGAVSEPWKTVWDYSQYSWDDWGALPISNGGGSSNMGWRVLTPDEWYYLRNNRTSTNDKWESSASAVVCDVPGRILLPDDWSSTQSLYEMGTYPRNNIFDATQWAALEATGAVFLPCSGNRGYNQYGVQVALTRKYTDYNSEECTSYSGNYWTDREYESEYYPGEMAYTASITTTLRTTQNKETIIYSEQMFNTQATANKSLGCAVRLVKDNLPICTDTQSGIEEAMEGLRGQTKSIKIVRDFYKDGEYNTICLPFDFSAEKIHAADSPLKDCELYTFESATTDAENKNLNFNIVPATSITAGVPYLIRWESGEDVHEMVFRGVTVTQSTGQAVGSGIQFVGTIGRTTLPHGDQNYLFVGNGGKLYWSDSTDDTSMKGFRAYFKVSGDVAPHNMPARLVVKPNMPTAIGNTEVKIQSMKTMKNGQLIIIKNGVKYNAQGQMIK